MSSAGQTSNSRPLTVNLRRWTSKSTHPPVSDSGSRLTRPGLGNGTAPCDVVYDEDQPVIVIAVQHFDIDACLGHASREHAELSGKGLFQSLHDHLSLVE